MLIVKDNPKGVDKPIQKLQSLLYSRLKTKWALNDGQWMCYGRAYKNQGEDGYIPEVYIGGNEYKEVFYDDSYPVISFFGVDDEREIGINGKVDVFLIFEVDIEKLKPSLVHRGDEETHTDVLDQLNTPLFGFTLTGLETGIENVYRDYNLYKMHTGQKSNIEGIKYRDMHPLHCFRVNMNLNYQNINC